MIWIWSGNALFGNDFIWSKVAHLLRQKLQASKQKCFNGLFLPLSGSGIYSLKKYPTISCKWLSWLLPLSPKWQRLCFWPLRSFCDLKGWLWKTQYNTYKLPYYIGKQTQEADDCCNHQHPASPQGLTKTGIRWPKMWGAKVIKNLGNSNSWIKATNKK